MLVDAYLALNDAAAAQAVLAEILKRFHGRPEADLARGRIHLAAVHLPQAVAAFDAACKALASRAAPPRLLADGKTWHGRALYFAGELPKAQVLLQDAAKADPSSFASAYYLGQVLYERGQLPDARAAFDQATKLDPTVADAFFYLGDAAFRLKDAPAAKLALAKYLQLAPRGDFAAEAKRMMK
jgi:tetratricopeptide (TPR) repeat protein